MLIIILLSFKTRTAVYFRPPVFLYFFKFILWRDRSIQISKLKIIVEDKKKKTETIPLKDLEDCVQVSALPYDSGESLMF